jgi:hypothetical protein
MRDEPKSRVLHCLDPVRRFEQGLEEAGFKDVRMGQTEDAGVWGLKMRRPPHVRGRTSSEMTALLRRIADAAQCPIAPGMLVTAVSGRAVVASFKAPQVGQRTQG